LLLRLFFFVLLIFLLLLVLKNYRARARGGSRVAPPDDDMVLDPQCHAYVPKREAVAIAGNFFCSRQCAERYLERSAH
jgi:hypothetical protein